MFLEASFPTIIKARVAQSSELSELEKFPLAIGDRLTLVSFVEAEQNHIRISLLDQVKDTPFWYVYSPHVRVIDGKGNILTITPQPETAPSVNRITPPDDEPSRDKAVKSNSLSLPFKPTSAIVRSSPGISKDGRLDLYLPLIAGGNFYWYEALHNGARIPAREEHLETMIRLATQLQIAREKINKPFTVTSWYRPEPYNKRAGGAKKSQHLYGGAVDIKVLGMSGNSLALALRGWEGGMGIYPNMPNLLHLDIRSYRARWGGA